MIERQFDIRFVAGLALREKQIQQNYRPVIAVHKWFARRPGTLFRGLLLSEFGNSSLPEAFYKAHALSNVSVIDPFMGGGTTLLEANRLGCAITGMDVNPMSYWVVREEIETLDLGAYQKAAATIRTRLESKLGHLYRTSCVRCGSVQANVKYFLWVKTIACQHCAHAIDLFPNFLIAEDVRHVANVFVCRKCNQLFESESRKSPRPCPHCRTVVTAEFAARKGQCKCAGCGQVNRFPIGHGSAPTHRLFAIEYHCSNCKKTNKGRFFKMADHHDLAKMSEAGNELARIRPKFVPEDAIPNGIETERLHRWGYQHYRQMFNSRQLLGLEFLCREISAVSNVKLKRALSTNLSDLLRYQNMLCRYDSMALKSLDVFSIHGFPIGQIQCESNLLGIEGDGVVIGSGGLLNIIDKFAKAKAYCTRPFEIRHEGQRKIPVFVATRI